MLVFIVFPSQRWAIFLLHIPMRTKKVEWETNEIVCRLLILHTSLSEDKRPYLPFCLKNSSSNSRRLLRILFFSSRASWSCSTSSGLCVCVEESETIRFFQRQWKQSQFITCSVIFFCQTLQFFSVTCECMSVMAFLCNTQRPDCNVDVLQILDVLPR